MFLCCETRQVFVHGALCVSYSGQCFSSEAWGGRSANRGQCAQACRLPYGLVARLQHTREITRTVETCGDCCSCIIAWCDIKGSERNCCNVKCRQCLGKSLAWCHVIRMLAAKDVSCCLSRPGAVCRTFCFFIQGEGWRIDRFGLLVIS